MVVEFSDVSVNNFVNCSVDVFIEEMFVVVVADDVIGVFVDFIFEFADTVIVVAVVVAIGVDSVADDEHDCCGEIVVADIFVGGVAGVDVVDNAIVNFNDESSGIIDDVVESFIDNAEVFAEDGFGFMLDGSIKVVVDDLNIVVGDDVVETVAVESIDWVTDDFNDVIASSGFVADDNDSVEVEVAGFADVSDDNIDADVESCVEIDLENIIVGMESDADDIAIVSVTVALIFIVESVDVIICDGSTDVEGVDVSGELNFAEDDSISIVPIDSILF